MKLFELEFSSGYGCLALLDVKNYLGFVDEDWELEQIKEHVCTENQRGNIIAWGTTSCNWKIEVHQCSPFTEGYRSHISTLVTEGKLLLTDYDSIIMAAQFSDTTLPEEHENDQVFEVERGIYEATVVQNFPTNLIDTEELWELDSIHYYIFLKTNECTQLSKGSFPWFVV